MSQSKVPFAEIIAELLDHSKPFSPVHLHRFSDLERYELRQLNNAWNKIDPNRRLALLSDLEDLGDTDTLVDFDPVALIGLQDSEGPVRAQAAKMLWEYLGLDFAHTLLKMVVEDPFVETRAAAASALGRFVYEGEIEEIPADELKKIENRLLAVMEGDDDKLVKRRALEALGFSGREEVPGLIRNAYDSSDREWMVSALLAMGRSYDQAWDADVRRQLRSSWGDVQLEAVRAAGELGLDSARRTLLDLLEEEGTDSEIRAEVIWALSEIGGEQVREVLEQLLEDTDDDEEAELIDEALDNLTLTEQIESFDLLDIDLEEEARSAHIVDLLDGAASEEENAAPPSEPDSTDKKSRQRHKKI